jgi:ring-1,2-phenylacetyl-CoA epoxidase subunit PaaC
MTAEEHGHVDVQATTLGEEIVDRASVASADVAEYATWLGDDALILAQQLGWWISRAPELEEDIALGNIALDLIGHARSFLHYAGGATGRSEDDLAYFRDEHEFRSVHLVEQPNGDFAHTIVRQLLMSVYLFELYRKLVDSADPTLAAVAGKAVKEVDYHRDHASQWILRLALGTDESRSRLLVALDDLWPYLEELFRDEPLHDVLAGTAVRPSELRAAFDAVLTRLFADARLELPRTPIASGGGRRGEHSEYLGYLLTEMQVLARRHPGASW